MRKNQVDFINKRKYNKIMNIEKISVSRYDTWTLCQQLYLYKYHLKIPSEMEQPFYFIYGKIIHKIAEEYVKRKGETTITEIANEVLKGKIEVQPGEKAPHLPTEYQKRLPNHLRTIKKITDKIGYDGELEYKFELDLDPPNNKLVTGFIDRLIIKDNKFFIIDYKTTKKGFWRKNNFTILKDLQLRTYARMVQKIFNANAEDIKATLIYLEDEEIKGCKFSQESLLSAEKQLLEAFDIIKNFPPERAYGNVGNHCLRCDYRKHCPFFSLLENKKT